MCRRADSLEVRIAVIRAVQILVMSTRFLELILASAIEYVESNGHPGIAEKTEHDRV